MANPRGFCAGVDRAIEIVERALELFGPPIHVRHEVVHNRYVVEELEQKGAIFVDELEEVPDDSVLARALQEEENRLAAAQPRMVGCNDRAHAQDPMWQARHRSIASSSRVQKERRLLLLVHSVDLLGYFHRA